MIISKAIPSRVLLASLILLTALPLAQAGNQEAKSKSKKRAPASQVECNAIFACDLTDPEEARSGGLLRSAEGVTCKEACTGAKKKAQAACKDAFGTEIDGIEFICPESDKVYKLEE